MDVAYDHIQEEVLSPEQQAAKHSGASTSSTSSTDPNSTNNQQIQPQKQTLNAEFQEAYNSLLSTSPWGAKIGGFFSDVKKQSTTFYDEARQEAGAVGGEAFKGFSDLRQSLVSRARSLSTGAQENAARAPPTTAGENEGEKDDTAAATAETEQKQAEEHASMVARFRVEAAKRLKDLEKAEEAADAAIFRFGANIGNFLKEAVTIAPPADSDGRGGSLGKGKVLFESKGEDGKRVIHGSRLEAQLHAIHTSTDKFTADPESEQFRGWKEGFSTQEREREGAIKGDLERYEELRKMKERLVPEKVSEADFWTRYYFLRMVVEAEEARRKEVLKGAAAPDTTTPSWDSDSDSDAEDPASSTTPQQNAPHPSTANNPSTPKQAPAPTPTTNMPGPTSSSPTGSLSTLHPSSAPTDPDNTNLKPTESRRSQDEKSQPDSDASYDLVSGATSRAPGSPREREKEGRAGKGAEDEEEEDWE